MSRGQTSGVQRQGVLEDARGQRTAAHGRAGWAEKQGGEPAAAWPCAMQVLGGGALPMLDEWGLMHAELACIHL